MLFSAVGLVLLVAALVEALGLSLSSPLLVLGLEEVFDDVVSTSYMVYLSYFLLVVWESLALSGMFSALSLWRVSSRLCLGCLEVLGLDSLLGIGESDLDLAFLSSSLLDLPLLDGGEL